ncbi:MAG: TetR/AcrR family transcriptional regulator [Treponema sp.]
MAKFERKTKEERKSEIMDAAKRVFLNKGYRYATMEDVVAETSLSKGGVYQYYKSTKSIMFDIMQDGNSFRYRRTEELMSAAPESDDVFAVVANAVMAKIFDRTPEKRLYLMFLFEILYDKDTEDLFFKLEEQAYSLMVENIKSAAARTGKAGRFAGEDFTQFVFPKLYTRILNGVLVMYELFSDKDVFESNRDEVFRLVYDIVKKSFELCKIPLPT